MSSSNFMQIFDTVISFTFFFYLSKNLHRKTYIDECLTIYIFLFWCFFNTVQAELGNYYLLFIQFQTHTQTHTPSYAQTATTKWIEDVHQLAVGLPITGGKGKSIRHLRSSRTTQQIKSQLGICLFLSQRRKKNTLHVQSNSPLPGLFSENKC